QKIRDRREPVPTDRPSSVRSVIFLCVPSRLCGLNWVFLSGVCDLLWRSNFGCGSHALNLPRLTFPVSAFLRVLCVFAVKSLLRFFACLPLFVSFVCFSKIWSLISLS